MKLSSSDRSTLVRLASSLPKGSEERRAILAGLRALPKKLLPWKYDRFFHVSSYTRKSVDGLISAMFGWSEVDKEGYANNPEFYSWSVSQSLPEDGKMYSPKYKLLKKGKSRSIEQAQKDVDLFLAKKGYTD